MFYIDVQVNKEGRVSSLLSRWKNDEYISREYLSGLKNINPIEEYSCVIDRDAAKKLLTYIFHSYPDLKE